MSPENKFISIEDGMGTKLKQSFIVYVTFGLVRLNDLSFDVNFVNAEKSRNIFEI